MPSRRRVSRLGRRARTTAATLALATSVAACAATAETDAAAAAQRFERALSAGADRACGLLAPETLKELESLGQDCPAALAAADLPSGGAVVSTHVAGHSAQVVLAGDTVFLALFDSGWKVTAAGCASPEGDSETPRDCAVKGA